MNPETFDCVLPCLSVLNRPKGGVVLDFSWEVDVVACFKKIDSAISFEIIRNCVGVL